MTRKRRIANPRRRSRPARPRRPPWPAARPCRPTRPAPLLPNRNRPPYPPTAAHSPLRRPDPTSAGSRCSPAPSSSFVKRPLPGPAPCRNGPPDLRAGHQTHAKTGAAQLLGTTDIQRGVVRLDDILDDGQPDAVALHPLVAAHATLQDTIDLFGRDARAVVLDGDLAPGPPLALRGQRAQ